MGTERVLPVGRGLALAKTHMIGNYHPMRSRQRRDEIAIDVAPGGLSVQQQDWPSAAFIDEMLPESRGFREMRRERPGVFEVLVCPYHRCVSLLMATTLLPGTRRVVTQRIFSEPDNQLIQLPPSML